MYMCAVSCMHVCVPVCSVTHACVCTCVQCHACVCTCAVSCMHVYVPVQCPSYLLYKVWTAMIWPWFTAGQPGGEVEDRKKQKRKKGRVVYG